MQGCISCRVRRYEQPPTATSIRRRPVQDGTAGATHGENTTRTDVRFENRTRRDLVATSITGPAFTTTMFATTETLRTGDLRTGDRRTGAASRAGGQPRPARADPGAGD